MEFKGPEGIPPRQSSHFLLCNTVRSSSLGIVDLKMGSSCLEELNHCALVSPR